MEKKTIRVEVINKTRSYKVNKRRIIELVSELFRQTKTKEDAYLSVAFVGEKEIKKLNKNYRGKNKPTNVLSFSYENDPLHSLSKIYEIIICLNLARKESLRDNNNLDDYVIFLIIHGFLHLIGYDHKIAMERKKMEHIEEELLLKTKIRGVVKREGLQ